MTSHSRRYALAAALWLAPLASTLLAVPGETAPPPPEAPQVADASDEAEQAMSGFRLPPGLKVELWAAEPMLANPVAFCLDHRGRIYVCETFRQSRGIEDNRGHAHWLDDDLAAQTVEDRLAYIRRHLGEKAEEYTRYDDRVRLLADTDGDGRADRATVFADRFNSIVEGTAAGVLAHGDRVYLTCIPHLWLLQDRDGDGRADVRQSLSYGYGVRFAFRGHDMHGLVLGPDGRLYFSIGDRGLNVKQGDKHFVNPESGAVLRCELDGSNLELFATGLRNPQELAFDDYGNLFTGDNNSDSGDQARWVHVVEGGDSGWRMAYQYLPDRGPFNREKIWHPARDDQPAYIVPPVINIASGPSGLAWYPGTGLPEHFRGRFLLVDFRGGPANSGIRSFRVRPKGAGFELIDAEETIWNVLATDVDFGPDGAIYLSDWINGWNGEGKGRIYRFSAPETAATPIVQEVKRLLAEGFSQRPREELTSLLAHADRRVRQGAQFALAERNEAQALAAVATGSGPPLARIHALWALGQIARAQGSPEPVAGVALALLADGDAEVRAQAARVLGEARAAAARDALVARLQDANARVQYFAAQSLGKLGSPEAIEPLLSLLEQNADRDRVLRHGAVMGLAGAAAGKPELLVPHARHSSPAARLGVLLALRRLAAEEISLFLDDPDPRLVTEAARAIYDLPLPAALPKLAALVSRGSFDDALMRRVLAANYRLGTPEAAEALAAYAARGNVPTALRLEALEMLGAWEHPSPRDRVLGMWRPTPPRPAAPASEALRRHLAGALKGSEGVRALAGQVAARLGIREVIPELESLLKDSAQPAEARANVLPALVALDAPNLEATARRALADPAPEVRAAARTLLAQREAPDAVSLLGQALEKGQRIERQAALAALATLRDPAAVGLLAGALEQLLAGRFPADAELDLLTAAAKRNDPTLAEKLAAFEARRTPDDPAAAYRECLEGGVAARGRQLFFERSQLSCVRCHRVQGTGGDVGPDLSKIAIDKPRTYLLEAVVAPNKAIAKNYESVVVLDIEGRTHTGVLKAEDDRKLTLVTAEGAQVTIAKDRIEARKAGKSPMPEDITKYLTKAELRDLVEFLASLKQ